MASNRASWSSSDRVSRPTAPRPLDPCVRLGQFLHGRACSLFREHGEARSTREIPGHLSGRKKSPLTAASAGFDLERVMELTHDNRVGNAVLYH